MPNRRADFETCLLRADRVSEGRNTPALIAATASAMTFFNSPPVPEIPPQGRKPGFRLAGQTLEIGVFLSHCNLGSNPDL